MMSVFMLFKINSEPFSTSASWRMPLNAVRQTEDMYRFRASVTPEMKERFQGMMQTVWSGAGQFLDEFYGRKTNPKADQNTQANCFKTMFDTIQKGMKE